MDAEMPEQGLIFWPVGNGDSTTIVVDDEHVVQVDLCDLAKAREEDAPVSAVVDRLVEALPTSADGKPYLAAFILTHADRDHCTGFADLLDRVRIGEIWATPRLWREYAEPDGAVQLCEDAKAFQEEAERRVARVCKAIEDGVEPASGDRIRVIGYDTDREKHAYSELPDKYVTYPGDAVTSIDATDMAGIFEVFIHAPFKDDCAAARNDTSVAMQVTLKDGSGGEGHALFFGDLAYETIIKIFDYSEGNKRSERLAWDVMLAAHHGSKKVMYVAEGGEEVLKQDILDAFSRHGSAAATVVISSAPFSAEDSPGDNPPHCIARERYEEVTDVICTAEYPS
jgi:beta-lactamase superfamily II metal-dependent hydrolase